MIKLQYVNVLNFHPQETVILYSQAHTKKQREEKARGEREEKARGAREEKEGKKRGGERGSERWIER